MSNTVKVETPVCMVCKQSSVVGLTVEEYDAWSAGAYAQDALPNRSADFREQLITGTHSKCWDDIFGGDDDE